MASVGTDIIIRQEYRPCWVNGKKGLFHKWLVKKDFICQNEYAVGLVEFENGSIEEIKSERIYFSDRKVKKYVFKKIKKESK